MTVPPDLRYKDFFLRLQRETKNEAMDCWKARKEQLKTKLFGAIIK
jgi:hypothetical protein